MMRSENLGSGVMNEWVLQGGHLWLTQSLAGHFSELWLLRDKESTPPSHQILANLDVVT